MSETKKQDGSDVLTKVVLGLVYVVGFYFVFIYKGSLRRKTWSKEALCFWLFYFSFLVMIVFAPKWNIPSLLNLWSPGVANFIYENVARVYQVLILWFFPFLSWLALLGVWDRIGLIKYQRAIDYLGLKTPTGLSPKVIQVNSLENSQKLIVVKATGIDVADFRSKKGVLESGLNVIVQEIRVCQHNRQLVEILVSQKELPKIVRFDEVFSQAIKPYTFVVGTSFDRTVVTDLCKIHHLLVAGSTGGGKSFFLRQALVGLLKSSNHIQLYLIDLKRGVDMRPFGALCNVRIAKDNAQAIEFLKMIHAEMDRRFQLLEKKEVNEIDTVRDKLDRIVVAIDEASELFTLDKGSKVTKAQAEEARMFTDKLAKLGRAAGIHVVLGTQKVVKETIDTRVQTNINAKLCFRVNTIASSMTVLGHKKAAELPKINGRAIWSVGSEDMIVQVPLLDGDEFKEEMDLLKSKFNGQTPVHLQPMLQVVKVKKAEGSAFKKRVEDENIADEEDAA